MSAALWLALVASLPVEPLLPGSPAVIRGHTDAITALAVSADGHRVATASRDGSIRVWSLDDGKELASVPTDGKSQVNAIAFSPDGTLLATGNVDLQVRLLDVATGAVKRVTAFPDAVFEVGFRPDGRELAVAGASGQTLVLTVADGTWAKSELPGRSARYSADGKLLVLGSRGGGLAVADPVSHQVKKNIATGSHLPLVALSADGSLIASWNAKERDVHLWQVKTGKEVGLLAVPAPKDAFEDAPKATVTALAMTPSGATVVTAAADRRLRVWKVATKTVVTSWPLERPAALVVVTPDERQVVVADGPVLKVWPL